MSKSKPTPKAPLTDALKAAIQHSGLTRYEIAKRTGVPPTSLMRFLRGDTSLRLDKADAVADCLGLELVKKRKSK
ncbi:MAG TPA: helix-turn-helix transcriptional regulator [Pirellulales bacterium]|jgi:transcriptional regulator with XRE-family HTH domain